MCPIPSEDRYHLVIFFLKFDGRVFWSVCMLVCVCVSQCAWMYDFMFLCIVLLYRIIFATQIIKKQYSNMLLYIAYIGLQAPLSMKFSRQEQRSGLPSSWPRDWTHVFCVSCIGMQILPNLGSPLHYSDSLFLLLAFSLTPFSHRSSCTSNL